MGLTGPDEGSNCRKRSRFSWQHPNGQAQGIRRSTLEHLHCMHPGMSRRGKTHWPSSTGWSQAPSVQRQDRVKVRSAVSTLQRLRPLSCAAAGVPHPSSQGATVTSEGWSTLTVAPFKSHESDSWEKCSHEVASQHLQWGPVSRWVVYRPKTLLTWPGWEWEGAEDTPCSRSPSQPLGPWS